MSVNPIDPKEFNYVSTKLREFFKKKGLIEVPVQHRLTILSACEDPATVSTFDYCGKVWPLRQTGQMDLELEIMTKPKVPGYFCYSTSYRQEPNPVEGRHDLIFPMIEFEIHGDMTALMNFEKEMLEHLGYGSRDSFPEGNYEDLCKKYGVTELTHEHETQIEKDYGPVFFLKNFPERTSPFFNMKRNDDPATSKKIDVIMSGIETVGSAERSCDVEDMRQRFYTISNGQYANTLYSRFGKERVEKELDDFLKLNFIERSGAGIGVTRLIRSLKQAGLMKTD
jgi:aspartyl/asparaginyl-tRNA synthetase